MTGEKQNLRQNHNWSCFHVKTEQFARRCIKETNKSLVRLTIPVGYKLRLA